MRSRRSASVCGCIKTPISGTQRRDCKGKFERSAKGDVSRVKAVDDVSRTNTLAPALDKLLQLAPLARHPADLL